MCMEGNRMQERVDLQVFQQAATTKQINSLSFSSNKSAYELHWE
jgi:hypothetical protein